MHALALGFVIVTVIAAVAGIIALVIRFAASDDPFRDDR